jgi:hypothetical protein
LVKGWFKRRGGSGPAPTDAQRQKAWEAHHDAFQKHQAAATIYTKEGDKLSADYYAGRAKHHLEQMKVMETKFGSGEPLQNAS